MFGIFGTMWTTLEIFIIFGMALLWLGCVGVIALKLTGLL